MNVKLNKILMLVVALGFLGFTTLASAAETQTEANQAVQTPGKAFQQKRQAMADNFAKELGLTDEQQAQLKAQREQQKKENQAVREQLRAKNQELRQELEKATIDEAKVSGLVSEITALEGKKLNQHVAGVIATKKILTPEQQAKMKAKMDERKEHMRHKMGGKMGGGARERMEERFDTK
ncbi:MAG: periplasmic heavy metal sensor [Candidatus Omnitrophica bacterium]|nr:periplasmic heavy metal sensor [Candidatus Omnitrophota bacterium]HOX53852.1 periplasmic heavy metal sensor [Candidatus Omnitrophota bacterium]